MKAKLDWASAKVNAADRGGSAGAAAVASHD
jgi:hypothetical protein